MLSIFNKRPCFPNDITMRYLKRRLRRLDKRIAGPDALPADYINRDRVARQLTEAKEYLC